MQIQLIHHTATPGTANIHLAQHSLAPVSAQSRPSSNQTPAPAGVYLRHHHTPPPASLLPERIPLIALANTCMHF